MTNEEQLLALKALRLSYKEILVEWLRTHNKKGIKYVERIRDEWRDEEGWSHWGERQYHGPVKAQDASGAPIKGEDYLPWLTPKQMNKIFNKAGKPPVNFEAISKRSDWVSRMVDATRY